MKSGGWGHGGTCCLCGKAAWVKSGMHFHCMPTESPGIVLDAGNTAVCCAESFSRVRLFAAPWTEARQAPLSTGFSRQEHWRGLPCPPPEDLPNPRIGPRSPTLQADSLPAEPPGKPQNTGVGSLSLLQGIFLTQESNPGLRYCRRILHRLSHQGSDRNRAVPVSRELTG